MNTSMDKNRQDDLLLTGGLAAVIGAISMFVAVALQMATGWFPADALTAGDMAGWLATVSTARTPAMFGVGFMLLALALYMVVGWTLYKLLEAQGRLAIIGLGGYLVGVPAAFVSFSFGLAVTWQIVPLHTAADASLQPTLVALAAILMRIFLVGDDFATLLIIGVGNVSFALAAGRAGWMPRWLTWLGVAAGSLWLVAMFGYLLPPLAIAQIGAPLGVLWILVTGIVLLRRRQRIASSTAAHMTGQPA